MLEDRLRKRVFVTDKDGNTKEEKQKNDKKRINWDLQGLKRIKEYLDWKYDTRI